MPYLTNKWVAGTIIGKFEAADNYIISNRDIAKNVDKE